MIIKKERRELPQEGLETFHVVGNEIRARSYSCLVRTDPFIRCPPFVCCEVIVKELPLDFSHVWSFTCYVKNTEHRCARGTNDTKKEKENRVGGTKRHREREYGIAQGKEKGRRRERFRLRIRRKSNTARGFHFRMHELACAILGNNLHRPFYARLVSSFALSTSRCKATLCLFFNPLFFSVFGDRGFASFFPLRFFVSFSSSVSSVSSSQPVLSPFLTVALCFTRKSAYSAVVDNAQNAESRMAKAWNNRDHDDSDFSRGTKTPRQ